MNTSAIILAAATVGMVVNTAAVLGIAWRGGQFLGRLDRTMDVLGAEVGLLRVGRAEDSRILERTVAQLVSLERRVDRLEDAH